MHSWPVRAPRRLGVVRVLDVDPDLARGVPEQELALARDRAMAARIAYDEPGRWPVGPEAFDGRGHLGLLIVGGLLVRQLTVGQRTCAELLGEGDVLRPWVRGGQGESPSPDVGWTVVDSLRVAVLDRRFALRVARWPEIAANVSDRILLRARSLGFHLAVCHVVRVEERLVLTLWHFADRWGRVTPDGVVLPLPLSHRLLASIVGAHRPSVTTALTALTERDLIHRRADGSWLLRGGPPASFAEVHRQLGSNVQ